LIRREKNRAGSGLWGALALRLGQRCQSFGCLSKAEDLLAGGVSCTAPRTFSIAKGKKDTKMKTKKGVLHIVGGPGDFVINGRS